VLLWCIGKIGEQSKTQVRVRIPQEMEFQLLQQGLNFVSVGQERGDDYRGVILDRNAFLEIQPGQEPGRDAVGDEPVDQTDGHGRGGQQIQ
jgi:hypothetical protein